MKVVRMWPQKVEEMGDRTACKEGCQATGRRTALSLLGAAAELAKVEDKNSKAGTRIDQEGGPQVPGRPSHVVEAMEEG